VIVPLSLATAGGVPELEPVEACMETTLDVRGARRTTEPVIRFVGGAAGLAIVTGWVLWIALPYEQLRRYTPDVRFLLWEGVAWLLALVLGFLGLSCVLQVVGSRIGTGVKRQLGRPGADTPLETAAALLPWAMIAYSLFLILAATFARSFFAA
jgi:hypothetical protein